MNAGAVDNALEAAEGDEDAITAHAGDVDFHLVEGARRGEEGVQLDIVGAVVDQPTGTAVAVENPPLVVDHPIVTQRQGHGFLPLAAAGAELEHDVVAILEVQRHLAVRT